MRVRIGNISFWQLFTASKTLRAPSGREILCADTPYRHAESTRKKGIELEGQGMTDPAAMIEAVRRLTGQEEINETA